MKLLAVIFSLFCSAVAWSGESTFTGEVRWMGNLRRLPEVARIEHQSPCPHGIYETITHKDRRLTGIAVWLVPVGAPLPFIRNGTTITSLNLMGCQFTPRIAFAFSQDPVVLTNQDPQEHWIIAKGQQLKHRQWRVRTGQNAHFTIGDAERVRVWSAQHRWMDAWIVVADTPWRILTDGQGRFDFHAMPHGDYVLHVWHPALGEYTEVVTHPTRHPIVVKFDRLAEQTDPELSLGIPLLREEWQRSRGDRPYR